MIRLLFAACVFFMLFSSSAAAYIGPGIGTGTIGVVLGILASIFLAFLAILWYPFKRLLKKYKSKTTVEKR